MFYRVEPNIENLTFVSDEGRNNQQIEGRKVPARLPMVKLNGIKKPVPLGSMGDGIKRIFQILVKTFQAQGGFLLIDEIESGLHYSIQEALWKVLFKVIAENDIQLFATTHSWDCIESFAVVANENQNIHSKLIRIGTSKLKSNYGQIISTVFDNSQLYNITQSDVEVR